MNTALTHGQPHFEVLKIVTPCATAAVHEALSPCRVRLTRRRHRIRPPGHGTGKLWGHRGAPSVAKSASIHIGTPRTRAQPAGCRHSRCLALSGAGRGMNETSAKRGLGCCRNSVQGKVQVDSQPSGIDRYPLLPNYTTDNTAGCSRRQAPPTVPPKPKPAISP